MGRKNPLERLPQAVAEAVVIRIVEMIDVDDIVRRVDVNNIVERVDVNRIVERVDVNELMERVDVNELMERVDVDALMERVDIDKLMERTELQSIIARSTTGALSEFLNLLRRQAVSIDGIVDRISKRARRLPSAPVGPKPLPIDSANDPESRLGHYAGSFSRLVAITIDVFAAWWLFLLSVAATQATLSIVMSRPPDLFAHNLATVIVAVPFFFFYFAWQWSLGGRTLGMAFTGIRVVDQLGGRINKRHAVIRTLVMPFSILVFGLGLIPAVLRPDRRTMHDLAAETSVIYDWDAKASRLRWLES